MGAKVELTGEKGTAPVRIRGGRLKAIDYIPPVASAQVKSCVLLAGLFAGGRTTVRELRATRDHTERMLSAAGAQVNTEGLAVSIEGAGQGRPDLRPLRMAVPGDFSSAAFWLVAAACRPGDRVVVEGVGLNPRRTALLDVLRRMGAVVDARMEGEDGGEPFGCVTVEGARLKGTVVGGDEIPNLIDELPAIAVAGALADGETVIRDAAELRVKESDRISTMARNLRALGVGVREMDDGMVVQGGASVSGGRVGSMGDHRIAMSFAVLAIHSRAAITIENVDCVATSYPGFMDHLLQLSGTPG
jgi:3-phosphoshikimate 1-carboxyvinyltransferase